MSMMWSNIASAVSRRYEELTPEQERLARAVIEGARHHAERRAILAFVQASGTYARYQTDAHYHQAVEVVGRVMVAGVFEEMPLTDEEKERRTLAMQTIMGAIEEVKW